MKTLFIFFISGILILLTFSCGDDEKEMEYAKIYFPLATRADANGIFTVNFDYSRDTTFIVRAYCGGSILTPNDIDVNIELATLKFEKEQSENPAFADYELLPSEAYSIVPGDLKLVIKKNTAGSDLKINFQTSKLISGKKYILPFSIKSVSHYEIQDKYALLFFAVEGAE